MSTATALLIQHAPAAIALVLFIAVLIMIWRSKQEAKNNGIL
jgi:hypothetical protein